MTAFIQQGAPYSIPVLNLQDRRCLKSTLLMWTEAGGRTSTTAVRVLSAAVTQRDYSRIRRLAATTSDVQILLMDIPYLPPNMCFSGSLPEYDWRVSAAAFTTNKQTDEIAALFVTSLPLWAAIYSQVQLQTDDDSQWAWGFTTRSRSREIITGY